MQYSDLLVLWRLLLEHLKITYQTLGKTRQQPFGCNCTFALYHRFIDAHKIIIDLHTLHNPVLKSLNILFYDLLGDMLLLHALSNKRTKSFKWSVYRIGCKVEYFDI